MRTAAKLIRAEVVQQMANEGKYDKEIADYFGVSVWMIWEFRHVHQIKSGERVTSDKNRQIVKDLARQGLTSLQICERTGLLPGTVSRYRRRVVPLKRSNDSGVAAKPQTRRIDA